MKSLRSTKPIHKDFATLNVPSNTVPELALARELGRLIGRHLAAESRRSGDDVRKLKPK